MTTTSHFLLMALYAFLVSLVFAVLLRDKPAEQLKTGVMMFGGFIGVAFVVAFVVQIAIAFDLSALLGQ